MTTNGYIGRKASINTTAVQLTTTSSKLKNSITILASSGNSGSVAIGYSSGITASGASTDGFPLSAGAGVTVQIDNINKIWVIGSASGQVVNWIGD